MIESRARAVKTDALLPGQAFDFVCGIWRLERDIPGHASIRGTAWVRELGSDAARYLERVTVHTAEGARLNGEQRYRFERRENGFAVRFDATGALFQELRFNPSAVGAPLVAESEHLCGADLYRSRYLLGPWPCFVVEHRVYGPRKDYTSRTTFRAVSAGA